MFLLNLVKKFKKLNIKKKGRLSRPRTTFLYFVSMAVESDAIGRCGAFATAVLEQLTLKRPTLSMGFLLSGIHRNFLV